MTNVVVFCGGRGSSTIISALSAAANVSVTALVNAYDSGMSTGRVRHAVTGLLGPSDVRKNVSTIASAHTEGFAAAFSRLLEHRLPADAVKAEIDYRAALAGRWSELGLGDVTGQLPEGRSRRLSVALQTFADHVDNGEKPFDFSDLAIGNAAMAGLFLSAGDFGAAVSHYGDLAGVGAGKVVNVTKGEDLWLSARAGAFFCPDESVLVARTPLSPIEEIFLLPRSAHADVFPDADRWVCADELAGDPAAAERLPELGAEAAAAISAADVIVYGPGTQHSSLFPSYLTIGLAEAVSANDRAAKLLFLNAGKDTDQHRDEDERDYVTKAHYFLTRRGAADLMLSDLVTEVVAAPESAQRLSCLQADVALSTGAWTSAAGKHSGSAVVRKILAAAAILPARERPAPISLGEAA